MTTVEASYGFDQKGVLDNTLPDPIRPLRWYGHTSWLSVPILVGCAVALPQYALIYAGISLPLAAVWAYTRKVVKNEERDYEELFKNRADFSMSVPPQHPEDAAEMAADLKRPRSERKGQWIRQYGPASRVEAMTETVTRPDGSTSAVKYWRYRLEDGSRDGCLAMATYLKDRCPSVYRVVQTWWKHHHADKIAGQLWIGKRYDDLEKDQQRTVRNRTEFELFQGIFIGLRPDTWGKRYDRRPYFRSYFDLRMTLAREIPETERPSAAVIDAAPWPERFRNRWIYNGVGFSIDEDMASRYYFQKFRKLYPAKEWLDADSVSPRILNGLPGIGPTLAKKYRSVKARLLPWYRRYRDLMQDAAKDTGSRWILGLGWRKFEKIWLHYDRDMPQHTIVGGGSGYGKTVLLQNPIVSGIYNHSAVVWLDPKVDKSTVSLIVHHAMLAGRLDDLVMLSVSRSDCPYNSTMNPLGGYFDPSQIGNILAGLMPESAGDNQYFLDDARNIGRIVGTMVHWLGQYLTFLSDGNEVCQHPPRALLWLEYARVLGLHQFPEKETAENRHKAVDQALARFDEVWKRLLKEDRNFAPADSAEKMVYTMWLQQEYTARYWRLNFAHLLEYALNNRQRLLSWVMRIVYPHVCARDERFQDPLFPKFDTLELVSGVVGRGRMPTQSDEKPKPTLLQVYEQSGPHLLSKDGLALADRTTTMWAYLYERVIKVEEVPRLQHLLVRETRSLEELIGQAKRDPEEYGQGVANLRPVVQEIVAGEKFDVLCVPEPDLTWPKIHKEKKIVLLILGSMSDQKASDAVSKAFVQSLLGYCGHIQDRGAQDLDLVFCGDEFFSWATPAWAHIIDKCRSTGVRTMVACQSEAGMRYALKGPDLFKHIIASVRCAYTCTTSSNDDHKSFTEGIKKINIYTPVRTLGETPTMAGETQHMGFGGWGTNESWQFTPQLQPLVDPEMLGWLPKGCFFRRIQGEFSVFQAPLLKPAPFLFHDLVGLTDYGNNKDQRTVLVEGVDYSVDSSDDTKRMSTWGSADRLASVLGKEDFVDPDALPEVKPELKDGYRQIPITAAELLSTPVTPPADGQVETAQPGNSPAVAVDHDGDPAGGLVKTASASQGGQEAASADSVGLPGMGDPSGSLVEPDPASQGGQEAASADSTGLPGMSMAMPGMPESGSGNADSEMPFEDTGFDPDGENESKLAAQDAVAAVDPAQGLSLIEIEEDGLVARGALDKDGLRFGHWFLVYPGGTQPAGDGYYLDGERHGEWTFRNSLGLVVKKAVFEKGQVVSEVEIAPPKALVAEGVPPGPLPKPVYTDFKDAQGFRYKGLIRQDQKVGMWEVFRPNGSRSEIQHFDMTTGEPTGIWERYDESGDLVDTYTPVL